MPGAPPSFLVVRKTEQGRIFLVLGSLSCGIPGCSNTHNFLKDTLKEDGLA